jgi:hypothetical protein
MRLTTEQNNNYKNYIIDCIDSEPYLEYQLETKREKVQFLYDTFKNEKDYEIKKVGEFKAFIDWIQGLPTIFNIAFSDNTILKLAVTMGSLRENATEKEEGKVLDNYWSFIANKTMQLFRALEHKNSKILSE